MAPSSELARWAQLAAWAHLPFLCLSPRSAQKAFMQGKLKVKGNVMLSVRLTPFAIPRANESPLTPSSSGRSD